jgi:hypothetical protein
MNTGNITISNCGIFDRISKSFLILILSGMLVFILSSQNYAIPSFARQTHLSCNYCHYTYPTLTAFGRLFKLNGYTLTNIETIDAVSRDSSRTTLKLVSTYTLSTMVKSSFTSISKETPGADKSFVQSPEELSIFFSGEITPNIGAYVQTTYGLSDGTIGLDMLDVRYADHAKLGSNDLLYGITLNNMPTVQDVWNTTPAWGFPYFGSEPAPAPTASTILDMAMGDVAGLGAYALYNKLIYAEISFYHSSPAGASFPPDNTWMNNIKGVAPYWRLAIQHQWIDQYLEVGTYGISSKFYPTGISGLTNNYTDIGFDAQYEKNIENGSSLIFHAAFITEKQTLDAEYNTAASENSENTLRSLKADLTYNFPDYFSLSAGYFSTTGTSDNLLYAPNEVDGSNSGSPNSNGEILQLTFLPWMNTQFAVQYKLYNKFNGGDTNYDGLGRNASDNNTLYVMAWLVF